MKTKNSYVRVNDNYAGKISYYQDLLSDAVSDLSIDEIRFYTDKLEYFVNRRVTCSAELDLSMANESI